jgi:cytidine deaminase
LSDLENELIEAAQRVMWRAYNPYSGYHVGAAVLTESGSVYVGTLMENASYGLTICAEPAAILAANSDGDLNLVTLAVVGGPPDQNEDEVLTPCGRCRQIIYEVSQLCQRDIRILCCNKLLSMVMETTIAELLPSALRMKKHPHISVRNGRYK